MDGLWYVLVIVASLLNAVSLIVEKRLLRAEHALTFSASYSYMVGLLALLLIPFTTFSLNWYTMLVLVVYSITLALSYWITARLFRHGSLSTGTSLYNILPIVIVVILGFLLLGEQLTLIEYVAIAVMVVAAFFMVTQSNKKRDRVGAKTYDHTIEVSALLVGINWILLKYALTLVTPITFIFFTSLITPLIVWLLLSRRGWDYKKETQIDLRKYDKPIAAMAIITLAYRIMLYTAVALVPVAIAAPLNSALVVMITVLAGGFFFGEHHIPRKILLAAVMLIAAYFLIV